MNWYLQIGKNSDVVMSSKIKLIRNINGFPFKLDKNSEIQKFEDYIKENLYNIGYGLKFIKLRNLDYITKQCIVEKNLVNPDYVFEKEDEGALLINEDENIVIALHAEDNIELQTFGAGLDLENILNLAVEIDEKIEKTFGYAVSKKYGYLTSSLSNLGTGLKASVLINIPAICKTGNKNSILEVISSFGMNVRKVNKENKEDYIYEISNKQTLGLTEQEIIANVKIIIEKIAKEERMIRKYLAEKNILFEDNIYRSYGILSNCKTITKKETEKLLANIKMGTDLGILPEITDSQIKQLYFYTKPAIMQKYYGREFNAMEQDIKRAEIIKQIMKKEIV